MNTLSDRQLAHLSALHSLNEMLRKGSFYINTVTDVADALGTVPDGAAMRILRPLHCARIGDMAPELREALPRLIERAIGVPAHQFEHIGLTPERQALVDRGTVRLLTRGS